MISDSLPVLIQWILVANVHCLSYEFRRTNVLTKRELWKDNIGQCHNDQISFNKSEIITAFIAESLSVQSINLPNNGILFFGEKTELGTKNNLKCERKQSTEEVYFKQDPPLGYYNGSNWMLTKNGIRWQPALHVLQVPSSQDRAIIPSNSGTRILLEDVITVGTLIIAGRIMNNNTFNEELLRSVEGQFQFDLAPKLKSLQNINRIGYQWPKFMQTVAIVGEGRRGSDAGEINSNLEPKKMALICSYQQCQSTTSTCDQMFQPIGHCCHICGSMLRFRAKTFNFDKFQRQVDNYEAKNEIVKEYQLDIATLRIDHSDLIPQYQIVVLAREGTTRPFDERIYYAVLEDLAGIVYNNFEVPNSMIEVEEITSMNPSKDHRAMAVVSLLFIGAVVIGAIFAARHKFNFINIRELMNQSSVVFEAVQWRGTTAENELQLIRNDGPTSKATATNSIQNLRQPEPEYSSTFENIAFDGEIMDDVEEK